MKVLVEAAITSRGFVIRVDDATIQSVVYAGRSLQPLTDVVAEAPHLTELFEFFLVLYTVDRVVARRSQHWRRDFLVRFPVTDLAAWRSVATDLSTLIWDSMGDAVEFAFAQRGRVHERFSQTNLALEEPRPTAVSLLSDGLDSLCGAFALLRQRPEERLAFVSITTNSRKQNRIGVVRDALQRRSRNVTFCAANLYLSSPPRAQELTQRSRTMLAIAAGLTVAAGYGATTVHVAENGLGVLNLPVPGLQMRHHSSQVLHPANRRLWRCVASRLLGSGDLSFPNRFRTKGEMCRDALRDGGTELIRSTSSCDRPDRFDPSDNCGRCGSCLVRKIALSNARLAGHDVIYSSRPPREQPAPYDAATVQRYHAGVLNGLLAGPDPWPALVREHPTLLNVFAADEAAEVPHLRAETIALLRRHEREVHEYQGWLS